MSAALDVLGYLPAPAGRFNRGAADMLEGQMLAIGACSSIAVFELPRLQTACMLHGGHRGAAVTAVKWDPEPHSRDLSTAGHVRLASGDSAGGVVLWDVLSTSIIAKMDDVPAAEELLDNYAAASRGECCVQDLAWVLPQPGVLAVVVAPALLLLWDTKANALLWRRELAPLTSPETFTCIDVDPLDRRQVVLCGDAGALLVMKLRLAAGGGGGGSHGHHAGSGHGAGSASGANSGGGRGGGTSSVDVFASLDDGVEAEQRQYRVNVPPPAAQKDKDKAEDKQPPLTLQARFCADRDLLVVLLPRELLIFDLEMGQPAASSALGAGRQPFSHLLGVYGEGVSQGLGDEGGLDFVYCAHVDGSLSCWTRRPGELAFKAGPGTKLVAPQLKGSRGPQASMVAVCCSLWRDELLAEGGPRDGPAVEIGRMPPPASTTQAISRQLTTAVGHRGDGEGGPRAARGSGAGEAATAAGAAGGGGGGGAGGSPFSGRSLLVMVVSSDGRIWQWDVPVPRFPRKGFLTCTEDTPITTMATSIQQQQLQQQSAIARASPEAVPPQLTGLLHGLPSGIVCFAMHLRPLVLPSAHATEAAAAAAEAEAAAAAQQGAGAAGARATYATARRRRDGAAGGAASGAGGTPAAGGTPVAGAGAGGGAFGGGGGGGGGPRVEALQEVLVGAAGTVTGSVEILVVQRGLVNPLSVEVALSLAIHSHPVRGVAWLGPLPLLASYAAERTGQSHAAGGGAGWRNSVAITCMLTRRSVVFRNNDAPDAGPLISLRASPSGAYLLMVFKGAPAELWSTGAHQLPAFWLAHGGLPAGGAPGAGAPLGALPRPRRLRYVDLPFSAADWAQPPDVAVPWELAAGPPHTLWSRDPAGAPAARRGAAAGGGGAAAAASAADAYDTDSGGGGGGGGGAEDLTREPSILSSAGAPSLTGDQPGGGGGAGGAAQEQAAAAAGAGESPDTLLKRRRKRGGGGGAYRASINSVLNLQVSMSSFHSSARPMSPEQQHHQQAEAARLAEARAAEADMPEERLAFALTDGRSGMLVVRGRKVSDAKPNRPKQGQGPQPQDLLGTCVAAAAHLMFLGDADGTIMSWDTATGKCSTVATGMGAVRIMQLAPPPCPLLHPSGGAGLDVAVVMRLAVLFSGGAFCVVEVDAGGRLRMGVAPPQVCMQRAGSALGLGWLPLPGPIGGGAVLAAALRDGSLALLDACQAADRRPSYRGRQSQIRALLAERRQLEGDEISNWDEFAAAATPAPPTPPHAGASDGAWDAAAARGGIGGGSAGAGGAPQRALVGLAPPRPLGSALLMRRPWALLLRLVLQLGLSQEAVLYLSSPSTEEDEDVARELAGLLPRGARAQLARLASGRRGEDWGDVKPGLGAAPGAPLGLSPSVGPPPSAGFAPASAGALSEPPPGAPPRGAPAGGSPLRGARSAPPAGGGLQRTGTGLSTADTERSSEGWGLLTGVGTFDGDLVTLLRHIGRLRARGHLLHPDEWRAYTQAIAHGSAAERMAVAARVSGDHLEARFWRHLPATLAAVKAARDAAAAATAASSAAAAGGGGEAAADGPGRAAQEAADRGGASAAGTPRAADAEKRPGHAVYAGSAPPPPSFARGVTIKQVAAGRAVRLWDEDLSLAAAQERTLWHEAMPRGIFDAPKLLERRVLEYTVLGDVHTAVAFLLSTNPERSETYYRSAAITLALAATPPSAAGGGARGGGGGGAAAQSARATLHVQAAKVLSAHAASMGDTLLGVPLSVAAGLMTEGVYTLQEAGLWRLAANLIARGLSGTERAAALQRWAQHVLRHEGGAWRAAGLLTSAGCLRAALAVLTNAGLPDCAAAYLEACRQSGLVVPLAPAAPQQQGGAGGEQAQAASEGGEAVTLFDMLGATTIMGAGALRVARGEEVAATEAEFDSYCCSLISNL